MASTLLEMLLEAGVIIPAQCDEALQNRAFFGGKIGTNLIELDFLEEETLCRFLSRKLDVPCVDPERLLNLPSEILELIPRELALRYRVIPLGLENRRLSLAMADPSDLGVLDEIAFITGWIVKPQVCPEVRLIQALGRYYHGAVDERYQQLVRRLKGRGEKKRSAGAPVDEKPQEPAPAVTGEGVTILARSAAISPEEAAEQVRIEASGPTPDPQAFPPLNLSPRSVEKQASGSLADNFGGDKKLEGKLNMTDSTADDPNREVAERIRAEKNLEDQLRFFREVIEVIPSPIFYKDAHGRYLGCNEAFAATLGLSKDQIVGKSVFEIAPAELAQVYRDADEALMRKGGVQVYEAVTVFADGLPHNVIFNKACFSKSDGSLGGLVGVMVDITDHQRVEEALRGANQTLEGIFQAAPVAVLAMDLELKVRRWNPAAEQMFGWKQEEILGLTYPLIPQEDLEDYRQITDQVARGKVLKRVAVRRQKRDGILIDCDISLGPLYDGRRNLVGFIGVVEDVSERKVAENALKESERKFRGLSAEFRTLLDGIPDSLELLSPDLKIVWANRGANSRLRPEAGGLEGRYCFELWHQRDTPCEECPAVETFASGRPVEKLDRTPDGRSWGVKVFPITDQSGRVVNVINMATDVTEKIKLREDAMRAGRLASLGELAAGMAHEINNPNGMVLMNASLMLEAWPDIAVILEEHARARGDFKIGRVPFSRMREMVPSLLAEIQEGGQRIRRIVDDLKNFVRQEDSDLAEDVDLNMAVQAAVRLAGNTVRKSTGKFQATLGEDLPMFKGNQQRIEQVAVNLIMNACQALTGTDQGVFVVTGFDPARKALFLEVRDEGIGIPPENLTTITDPFFTTKRKTGGTGLGLSVSARIVKDHGGRLEFGSTPGKGTTFRAFFPGQRGVKRHAS